MENGLKISSMIDQNMDKLGTVEISSQTVDHYLRGYICNSISYLSNRWDAKNLIIL